MKFIQNRADIIANCVHNQNPTDETANEIRKFSRKTLAIQANAVKIDAMSLTPHGRLVMPDDITNAAQFLFSPNAKMICSQVLTVDSGYTFLVSKLSF